MRDGPQLNYDQCQMLTATVTEEAVVKELKGINDMTAPGVDDFGAKFFKVSCHIIKVDIMAAIQEFFGKNKLSKAVNSNASMAKDYRPISCSTTDKKQSIREKKPSTLLKDFYY